MLHAETLYTLKLRSATAGFFSQNETRKKGGLGHAGPELATAATFMERFKEYHLHKKNSNHSQRKFHRTSFLYF
jgi:hypothetical protein